MDFAVLAEAFDKMTKTSSRTELTAILVYALKQTPSDLVARVSYLTQGKLYPDFVGIEIGMAEKTAAKAIEKAYGADPGKIQDLMRKMGDLGDVASQLSATKEQMSFSFGKLTVESVYSALEQIAGMSGSGSSLTRLSKLTTLLNSASSLE